MATYPSQIAKITDNLYLSSFVGVNEFNIMKFNISCVITVCKEVPKCSLKNIESIKVEVVDRQTESLSKYFDVLADKINDVAKRNSASLVHCVAGISRSATIVLAYLMKYLRMNLKDAHSLVKSRRPLIRPNLVNHFIKSLFFLNLLDGNLKYQGFWKQLVDYEKTLFGTNSVKIIQTSIGLIPDVYENEVRTMIFVKNGQCILDNSIGLQNLNLNSNNDSIKFNNDDTSKINNSTNNSNNKSLFQTPINGKSRLDEQEVTDKLRKSHYTTTYRSSYVKP